MKRIYSLASIALITLLSFSFTSCDDDGYWYDDYDNESWWNSDYENPDDDFVLMSNYLRGHWKGTTQAKYYDENGILVNETLTTDIEFDKSNTNAIFGRGAQFDYNGSELVLSRTFSWRIDSRSGDIYMVYDGDNGSTFSMTLSYDDLYLSQNDFSGILVGNGETDTFSYTKYTYAKSDNPSKTVSSSVHFGKGSKR